MPVSPPGSPVSLSDEAYCWSHTGHRSRYDLPRSHKIPSSPSEKMQTGPPQKRKMPHMDSLPPDQRQIPPADTFSPTQMNHSHNKDRTPSSPVFPVPSMPRTIILSVLPFRFRHCLRLRLLFPLFIFSSIAISFFFFHKFFRLIDLQFTLCIFFLHTSNASTLLHVFLCSSGQPFPVLNIHISDTASPDPPLPD